jgi:hypothetical protein
MGSKVTPTVQNIIPTRFVRYDDDQPQPHCSARQVMGLLRGTSLAQFQDPDGTLTGFQADLLSDVIPEATARAVKAMRMPMDWCRMIDFQDGTGGDTMILPYKNVAYVNVIFVRILPSLPWYRFTHFRNVDGTEFNRALFVEPPPVAPYNVTEGYQLQPVITPPYFTGIEDADILVDTRARTVTIPPRALLLAAGLPLSNYSFVIGKSNVEMHFAFGFPPTTYQSRAPLLFDEGGNLIAVNPTPPVGAVLPDVVDWSSGMPVGLTRAVARLAVNTIYAQNWRGISYGLSSLSVDGASESYGSGPYGGDIEKNEEAVMKIISSYGIQMV